MVPNNSDCVSSNPFSASISIITAAYNVERYLPTCLDSILSQTFQDFELILIDDGSSDNTGRICDSYSAKDSRIRVVHQSNKGVSDSWNTGLDLVNGDYVGFVDSDDLIHPRMYEIMYIAIQKTKSDIVYCDYVKFSDDNKDIVVENDMRYTTTPSSKEDELIMLTVPNSRSGSSIWKGLYRYSCIKDLRFLSGMTWQDRMWSPCAILKANSIVRVNAPLYYYRIRTGSNSHSNAIRHYSNGLYVGCELMDYLYENDPEWVVPFGLKLFADTSYLYNEIFTTQSSEDLTIPRERINRALQYLSRLSLQSILSNPHVMSRRKLTAIIGKISFPLACAIKYGLLELLDN